MTKEHLIPLDTSNSQLQAERGRKGGLVRSDKKKYAAKIREMKKRGMDAKDLEWFMDRIEDPTVSIFDMYMLLDKAKDLCDKPFLMIQLADKYIQLHKAHHGEKIKSENTNININIDALKFQEKAMEYSK